MKKLLIAILAIALIASGAVAAEKVKVATPNSAIYVGSGTVREGGEDIATAVAILALPYSDSGDTSDNIDDYTFGSDTAPDVVYSFTPGSDIYVDVELCGSSYDTKLGIVDSSLLVVAYNDDACGLQSAVYNVALLAGETYYILVDGYGANSGPYTFAMTGVTPPSPNSFCGLTSEGNIDLSGDTCLGENLVDGLSCLSWSSSGAEAYYEIEMEAGAEFTAAITNTADGILSVLAECEAMPGQFTCLAVADDTLTGGEEVVSYTNDTGAPAIVYLVVDSYGSSSCGTFVGTFSTGGGAVATESASFDNLKSMFR